MKVDLLEEESMFAIVPHISDTYLSENPNISFTAHAMVILLRFVYNKGHFTWKTE